MEQHARAPEALKKTFPMDRTWKMWKQEFEIFLKIADYDNSDKKGIFLLNTMGKLAHEVMQDLQFENETDKLDYNILISKFDEYFDPPKREIEERYNFYTRHKKNNEAIDAYIADLKEKAKTCNFGDLTEGLIRDMVILDIKDKHLRQIMFDAKDLNIDKLIILYKQFELNTEKMKELSQKVNKDHAEAKAKDKVNNAPTASKPHVCWRCGISHPIKNCPARDQECEKCKEKGHFTQRCNNKPKNFNVNYNTNKNKYHGKSPFTQTEKSKK